MEHQAWELDSTSTIEPGPFGEADAADADLDSLHFVPFLSGSLATQPSDRRARILIGRKGSGKTLYLRRLHAAASTENSLFALQRETQPPATSHIMLVYDLFDRAGELQEAWPRIWWRALLRSVASSMLFDARVSRRRTSTFSGEEYEFQQKKLAKSIKILGLSNENPVSVCSQVTSIIVDQRNRGKLDNYLNSALWQDVEHLISTISSHLPPLCLYIDNLDEEFQLAPKHWRACQEGLFRCVMSAQGDPRFSNKLHVHVTLRDSVYSSILRSPHLTRYMQDKSIRYLAWNAGSALHFLNTKIQTLPAVYCFDGAQKPTNLQEWLGVEQVFNHGRGIHEDLDVYLLRHTRLLPRDIIILGNFLANKVARFRQMEFRKLPEDDIRSIVRRCAKLFGKEQLQISAEYLSSYHIPKGAATHEFEEIYLSDSHVQTWSVVVAEMLREYQVDRICWTDLEAGLKERLPEGVVASSLLNCLWWSGLIGYVESQDRDERHVFYTDENLLQFEFPKAKGVYVFHPSMIDYLRLAPSGHVPVVPFGEV